MRHDVRSELRGKVPEELLDLVPRSFDVIGSRGKAVAIIEVPSELEPYGTELGAAIMRVQGNVASVLSKGTERMGEYRIRDMKLLAGDSNTEVIHRESNCSFRVDPAKAYFSPRESTERERVSALVTPGERVLVMFSGVGPFPICIAKRQPSAYCVAVELNPDAHEYCVQNIALNKVGERVRAILGDVREVCPMLGEAFDRVLMPLPKGAYKFLDVALPMVKPGGILQFYHWGSRNDPFIEGEEMVKVEAKAQGRKMISCVSFRVSQYSPSAWKIRVDARLG